MTHRTFDEQIANFNRVVSSWDINQEYKVALLGMIVSLGYEHEKSITPEPHWIPVTERLPETELQHPGHGIGDYLKSDMVAVSGDFDYGDKVWIACYCDDLDGKTYWSDMDANTLYNVIAWMPLPEYYKG